MTDDSGVRITLPKKLKFLFMPHRYKVAYGGRGGGKSWAFAITLLVIGQQRKIRVLCAREVQKSIKDSVHKLLADQIDRLQLNDFYQVLNTEIKGRNGTEFSFVGLRHVDKNSMKSFEGADYCWIEEAHSVSKSSWDVLIPTIRKENSEIWLSLNPELETDYTYQHFILNPPPSARVQKINWNDNPHFPDVLKEELEFSKQTNYDDYLHIWEGHCKQMLEGAIYAEQLRAATEAGRITKVPYNSQYPVQTFWDLGWADNTTIWFAQAVPGTGEFRVIDFYQCAQKPINHYVEVLQKRGYVYSDHWLPHDSKNKSLATGKSIAEVMKNMKLSVKETPKLSIEDGINATRMIFNRCWFDESKCGEGLQCLRHYRYEVDPDTKLFSKRPLHDINSHAADAFRYFAVAIQEYREPRKRKKRAGSWLS